MTGPFQSLWEALKNTTLTPTCDCILAENRYQSAMDARAVSAHSGLMTYRQGSVPERSLVTVVDDDQSVRESLPDLVKEFGFDARAFSSSEEFLSSDSVRQTRCLILDIAMPGMTGLDLQSELKRRGQEIPVIFITAQKDEALRERAFQQGATEFLLKPFSDTALLEALNKALHTN